MSSINDDAVHINQRFIVYMHCVFSISQTSASGLALEGLNSRERERQTDRGVCRAAEASSMTASHRLRENTTTDVCPQ